MIYVDYYLIVLNILISNFNILKYIFTVLILQNSIKSYINNNTKIIKIRNNTL